MRPLKETNIIANIDQKRKKEDKLGDEGFKAIKKIFYNTKIPKTSHELFFNEPGYSNEKIKQHSKLLAEIKGQEDEITVNGKILENITTIIGEKSEWFGDKNSVAIIPTSDYDDRISHGDIIIEKKINNEIIRILIDITTSDRKDNLQTKLEWSEKRIREKKLSNIEYFQSQLENFKGKLATIPRVVVAIDATTLNNLCLDISKTKFNQQDNPVPLLMLDEIINQLDSQYNYCLKNWGNNHKTTKQLFKSLKAFQDLLNNKTKLNKNTEYKNLSRQDKAYKYLMQYEMKD